MRKATALGAALLLSSWGTAALAQPSAAISPPEPVHRVDAAYPAHADRVEVDVVLIATVDVDGHVVDVSIARSGGTAFDEAASVAAKQWTFAPAKRGDVPVRARIRLGFHFDPPPAPPVAAATPSTPYHGTAPRAGDTPTSQAAPTAPASAEVSPVTDEVNIRGRAHIPSRGAGDYEIKVGKLALVPRADAASLLRLAPGTFLTNEGGTGHPYQIFLRGFDAREGQDIEMTLDGMPINEVGNPHGSGLADTHFIIPELVTNLRVIEGPFAPQQGNFAVAGSALYDVGLAEPGLMARVTAGSFATKRLLLAWRPRGSSERTFGAGEVFSSDGFGDNRKSERATAMAGYEGQLGKTGLFRVLTGAYGTHYGSAGVLRDDDVRAGRKSFFGTYDTTQGGDSARVFGTGLLQDKVGTMQLSQSVFVAYRDFRLRHNPTGFLSDPQQTWQSPHTQRGDLIDQRAGIMTIGGRGSARDGTTFLGQKQELELGYYARFDSVDAIQQRNRNGTNIPYRKELDLESGLGNIGVYADGSVRPGLSWLTLRGGVRFDHFTYRATDRCAQRTQASIGLVPADTECFTSDRTGYRSADQTASTSASIFQPRATLLVGPFRGFTFSGSHGIGSRSIDPQYVNQDLASPFAEVVASEGGVTYAHAVGKVDLLAKSVFFRTQVDKDLFFNPTEGRNTLSDGTTRTGWAGSVRATGSFFDLASSVTLVRATFDDTNLLIPYAPVSVVRADGSLFGDLPFRLDGKKLSANVATGVSFVGERPLPLGERSNTIFTVDLAGNVRWRSLQVGLVCTNLFDRQYRLGEYNYTSDFRSQPYPTLVASRHFIAGEPRAIYATFTIYLGGSSTEDGT
ncbi:MAG: TonB family protein [Deltaproteobacteria bacterium]|nr:TonB family protein [Deltaproteobacteria bacterium]